MKKVAKPKRSGTAEILQQTLDDAIRDLPVLFLEQHIVKMLKEQGVKAPKGFARQFADHLLIGNTEPLSSPKAARGKQIHLTINDFDIEEVIQRLERFSEEQLPGFAPSMASKLSGKVLKNLKARWPEENSMQEADLAGFRERMEL
jgi:hypothetical protein